MYKGRIQIWAIVLIVAFAIQYLIIPFGKWCFEPGIETSVFLDTDDATFSGMYSTLNQRGGVAYNYVDSKNNNTDIIVKRHSDETAEGYTKYDSKLYTPFVVLVNEDAIENASEVVKTEINGHDYYTIDLKDILTADIGKDTFGDLGLSDSIWSNKDEIVDVCIPGKNTSYFDDVIKLFAITLYDTPTDDENVEERTKEIEKIVSKCTQINDLEKAIKNDAKNTLIIVPEALVADEDDSALAYNDVCYLTKEYAIKYDIYIKNDCKTKETVLKTIDNGYLWNTVKYRVSDSTWTVDNVSNYYLVKLKIIDENEYIKAPLNVSVVPAKKIQDDAAAAKTAANSVKETVDTKEILDKTLDETLDEIKDEKTVKEDTNNVASDENESTDADKDEEKVSDESVDTNEDEEAALDEETDKTLSAATETIFTMFLLMFLGFFVLIIVRLLANYFEGF